MKTILLIIFCGYQFLGISQDDFYKIQRENDSIYICSKEYQERLTYAADIMITILKTDYDYILNYLMMKIGETKIRVFLNS